MAKIVQVSLPFSWNHHHKQRQPLYTTFCALSKQGHRFLSSLAAAAGDSSAASRLIRKFIASSSKPIALNALSHLLSSDITTHISSLALPLYTRITTTSWFNWNPKLVASLIALLDQQGQLEEAETLLSESIQKIGFQNGDLGLFYCDLIDSYSKRGSKRGVFWSYGHLKQLLSNSSNFSLRRRASETIIRGLCALDLPHEAEKLMGLEEFKPSAYEFRCIVNGYGRNGSLKEMRRVLGLMEDKGYVLDTICSNIVLSSYGAQSELSEMVSWLRKMKGSEIQFSIRTYNSVLNSCPTIMSFFQEPKKLFPLTMEGLIEKLPREEALLVEELIRSSVLVETLRWSCSEGKLDLHGMHLGSALVMMLHWVEELRLGFDNGRLVVPVAVMVVCGTGRHSEVRGESPVKALVKEMMVRMRSPLRIDRRNVGCFVAKGKSVKEWLCLQH